LNIVIGLRILVRVITIYNQSGGVMKTSLTMNLGYQLAARNQSVLLIDMDPQASLTVFMGLEPADLEQTIADSILDNAPLAIQRNLHQMDLLPANITLSAVEMRLVSAMAREWRLKRLLEPIQAEYDFVLIDAPPSLGILSVLSLVASTHVLIPIQTQYKSYKGTELLLDSVRQVQEQVNPNLRIAGIVPTIYASANAQDKAILSAIQEQLAAIATIYPPVPRATAFADASMEHLPLALYSSNHSAIRILESIATGLEVLS
jgi:chromosome partitioning protein